MPPPLLVVEIVSPGEVQRNRDYVAKRMQYQDLGGAGILDCEPGGRNRFWCWSGRPMVTVKIGCYREPTGWKVPRIGSLNLATQDLFTAAKGKD